MGRPSSRAALDAAPRAGSERAVPVGPYVTCEFMGGLGNQMFQAAHALAQAQRAGVPCVFSPGSFTPLQGFETSKYRGNLFRNLSFQEGLAPEVSLREPGWEFARLDPDLKLSTVFRGYFQSDKNFYGYDRRIREVFGPDRGSEDRLRAACPELAAGVTCVHVRRGDYLMNPGIHPSVGVRYVRKGLKRIPRNPHVFVFSDDLAWCRKNLAKLPATVRFIEGFEDYEEMWLMSFCRNYVISNSTFSWWGAFLNSHDPEVVAPKRWFGPESPVRNYQDIYREGWIRV